MMEKIGFTAGMLFMLVSFFLFSTVLGHGQNMSQMGNAPWTKRYDRAAALKHCMLLTDDFERQKCVEAIK